MKIFLVAILAAVSMAKPRTAPNVPQFSLRAWASRSDNPVVDVTFANGVQDSLVLHRHYSSKAAERSGKLHCNFLGHLANELEACVAMTGCPGEDDVSLTVFSKNNQDHFKYHWLKDGSVIGEDSAYKNVEALENDIVLDEEDDDELEEFQEPPVQSLEVLGDSRMATVAEEGCSRYSSSKCATMPPAMRAELKIFYTWTFKDAVENQNQMAVEDYVDEMVTHIQAYYCLDQYLGTTLKFELVGGVELLPTANFTSNSVFSAKNYVAADTSGADMVSFLTDDIWGASGVAKSFFAKICRRPLKTSRLQIAEHSTSRSHMAELLAHEMGHTLGFGHDFSTAHDDKYKDRNTGETINLGNHKSQNCNSAENKGIMAGTGHGAKWSFCSAFDLLNEFRRRTPWCMEELTREEACGAQ